jgi:uncharacterized protein YvpB
MAKSLPVPFKSQWDEDARGSRKDCGPACVAMVLQYQGTPVTTDQVFAASGAEADAYIGMGQMMEAAHYFGLELTYHAGRSLEDLRRWLDEDLPVIALVNYGVWSSQGLTWDSFTGPHFVVVVGYDDEGNILINDPDYAGELRLEGDHKAYSADLFRQAWYDLTSLDNPNGAALVPSVTLPIFGPPTISRDGFCRHLADAHSPLAGLEAELAYGMCAAFGVDPAFPLALFAHASRLGTEGDTLETRNPGLLSRGSDGVDISRSLPERGVLQCYHSWLDGWRAMLHHLLVRHRANGRTRVAQVLPVWDTGADASAVIAEVEETMRGNSDL